MQDGHNPFALALRKSVYAYALNTSRILALYDIGNVFLRVPFVC